jgi:hypothetical protein
MSCCIKRKVNVRWGNLIYLTRCAIETLKRRAGVGLRYFCFFTPFYKSLDGLALQKLIAQHVNYLLQ